MARSSLLVALLPLLALSVATAGCGSTVIGGGDDGVGSDDIDDGSGDDASDDDASDDDSDDGTDGPGNAQPTSYVEIHDGIATLVFSSQPVVCGEEPSLPSGCTAQEEFKLTVDMPVAMLVPGTISLDQPGIESFTTSQGADRGGDDCWFGGGSGVGAVEILSVGETVVARVDMTLITLEGPDSLDFTMVRCGDEDPVEPTGTNALGFNLEVDGGGEDDGGNDSSTQAGGGEAEDRFVVQIANNTAASCGDTYKTPDCPFEARAIFVSLPMSRKFIGSVISLADETIYVGSSEQGPNEGSEDCWWGGGGGPLPGTLTFDAAGQGTMDVTFAGTGDALIEGAHTITVCE